MDKKAKYGEQAAMSFDAPEVKDTEKTNLHCDIILQRPLVFFDLETTGLDMDIDRIVQFAFLKVNPDNSMQEWTELVNPGIAIPPESSSVHHITDDLVKDKPEFAHYAPRIKAFLSECDLSGFNIVRFDVPFLQTEMTRNGYPLELDHIKIVDAQSIFYKMEPRTLSAAYKYYCSGEHTEAHDAMGDVRVTFKVLNAQLSRYTGLPRDVEKLASFCNVQDDRWVTSDRKFYWRHSEAVISFGKHKGKDLQWMSKNDREYLKWMVNGEFADDTKQIIRNALDGQFPVKQENQVNQEENDD